MKNQQYWAWKLLISGNSNELRRLTEGKQTDYVMFTGGVDHWLDCPNDDFQINSIYLRDDDDANTVSQVGYEILSLFNGASTIYERNYCKLELIGLVRNDEPHKLQEKQAAHGLLKRPNIDQAQFEDFLRSARGHDRRTFLLMLATENEDVYQILKYFDMSLNWTTYYKILETLEAHASTEKINLKCSATDRKSFTNTANNYSLSGLNSRHGFKQSIKENKTPSMSIEQAHQLVTKAARTYLFAKYGSLASA
jgi:hypothetical protein